MGPNRVWKDIKSSCPRLLITTTPATQSQQSQRSRSRVEAYCLSSGSMSFAIADGLVVGA